MISELYLDRVAIGESQQDFINYFIRELKHRGPVQFVIKKDNDDRVIYLGIRKLKQEAHTWDVLDKIEKRIKS